VYVTIYNRQDLKRSRNRFKIRAKFSHFSINIPIMGLFGNKKKKELIQELPIHTKRNDGVRYAKGTHFKGDQTTKSAASSITPKDDVKNGKEGDYHQLGEEGEEIKAPLPVPIFTYLVSAIQVFTMILPLVTCTIGEC
jgi:hypothetical protein